MRRRQFVVTAGSVLLSSGLAGCTLGDEAGPGTAVTETVVKDVPGNEDEGVVDSVTSTSSPDIALNGIRFQHAGQKGILVAGDFVNRSGRAFEEAVVEVALYDENETTDELLDRVVEQETRETVPPGEGWQWAATFRNSPLPEIDYYSVTARGKYD